MTKKRIAPFAALVGMLVIATVLNWAQISRAATTFAFTFGQSNPLSFIGGVTANSAGVLPEQMTANGDGTGDLNVVCASGCSGSGGGGAVTISSPVPLPVTFGATPQPVTIATTVPVSLATTVPVAAASAFPVNIVSPNPLPITTPVPASPGPMATSAAASAIAMCTGTCTLYSVVGSNLASTNPCWIEIWNTSPSVGSTLPTAAIAVATTLSFYFPIASIGWGSTAGWYVAAVTSLNGSVGCATSPGVNVSWATH